MDGLTITYLVIQFIAVYFLSIFFLTWLQNRYQMYEVIKPDKDYSLSIVIPCYNEADSIGKTIETILDTDYKGLKKLYVVDDCSKDNSYEIIKKYAKKYPQVVALQTPKNTGNAAGAKNYGAKHAKTELIGFSDADSFPEKDAIRNMVGFFNDPKVGAVTSRVLVKNRRNFLERIQDIEYKVIAFTRKLLGFIDAIYVTNGPLSIYRKTAYDEATGFDESNLTEDIEITWHFIKNGWKVHMALSSVVYTIVPSNIKVWYRQRVRWNVGGVQTIVKYAPVFFKCGMLGLFILPFFILGWALGIFGLFFLTYLWGRRLIIQLITTYNAVASEVAIVTFNDLNLLPNVLWYFGLILIIFSFVYTVMGLWYSKVKEERLLSLTDIFIYSFFYLLMYPPLLIYSIYKYAKGYRSW